jgi:hypothetical protein
VKNYVKSDPVFFRLIKQSMAAIVLVVVVFAALFPAPLLNPADISLVPNPSRAAWFLIWTQEVVSYTKYAIYPIIFLGILFCALPWLPNVSPNAQAQWFPRLHFILEAKIGHSAGSFNCCYRPDMGERMLG